MKTNKLITDTIKEYYKQAGGSTSPTDFVEYCVAQGHSRFLSIEVMMSYYDLSDDEMEDWLHEYKCAKIELLWSEIEHTATALGLTLTGQWSNHSDEYNIDVSF